MSDAALRQSIAAALRVTPRDERLGSAVWLYLQLLADCNHRGLVCHRLEKLAAELAASEEQVQAWLGILHGAGLIHPETPAPFLVIRISSWPADGGSDASPYGYRFQSKQSNESKSYRPEDRAALLKEILETLGESDDALFTGALDHYSPKVVRKALDRVRAAGTIRTSRTALFRYLLPKLSKHE
jgi:hypothetical protein